MIEVGSILDSKYQILEEVGTGAQGAVFLAKDISLERLVAIKVVQELSKNDIERFRREATILGTMRNKHLPATYGHGEVGSRPYIAMEWLSGQTLQEELTNCSGVLNSTFILELFRQLFEALSAIHSHGVCHRDIKPQNIMIDRTHGDDTILVRIFDFGLAYIDTGTDQTQRLTSTGMVVGTILYIAPEVWKGEAASSGSDIYSAGCVLFQALTGMPPFQGNSVVTLMFQHLESPPPAIETLNIQGESLRIILLELSRACLQKEAQHRPSANEALSILTTLSTDLKDKGSISEETGARVRSEIRKFAVSPSVNRIKSPKPLIPYLLTFFVLVVGTYLATSLLHTEQSAIELASLADMRRQAEDLESQQRYAESLELQDDIVTASRAKYSTHSVNYLKDVAVYCLTAERLNRLDKAAPLARSCIAERFPPGSEEADIVERIRRAYVIMLSNTIKKQNDKVDPALAVEAMQRSVTPDEFAALIHSLFGLPDSQRAVRLEADRKLIASIKSGQKNQNQLVNDSLQYAISDLFWTEFNKGSRTLEIHDLCDLGFETTRTNTLAHIQYGCMKAMMQAEEGHVLAAENTLSHVSIPDQFTDNPSDVIGLFQARRAIARWLRSHGQPGEAQKQYELLKDVYERQRGVRPLLYLKHHADQI